MWPDGVLRQVRQGPLGAMEVGGGVQEGVRGYPGRAGLPFQLPHPPHSPVAGGHRGMAALVPSPLLPWAVLGGSPLLHKECRHQGFRLWPDHPPSPPTSHPPLQMWTQLYFSSSQPQGHSFLLITMASNFLAARVSLSCPQISEGGQEEPL